jgi:deoxyribodipyrimidine photo-lyase
VQDVPEVRITRLNERPHVSDGRWVLYWMTAYRRCHHNFALQRAVQWSQRLQRPLVILDALRVGYRWNSDRFHRFIIDGMRDNAAAVHGRRLFHYPYIEPRAGAGQGLLERLAGDACVVVADDFPCFFHPRMYRAVGPRLPVLTELVDSNGLMPMRALERTFTVAHSYRRHIQKTLLPHLDQLPVEDPTLILGDGPAVEIPAEIRRQWPVADLSAWALQADRLVAQLPIDHSVRATELVGGQRAAAEVWARFLANRLEGYGEARNEPEQTGSTQLSPYLHFGHISAAQMFRDLMHRERWQPEHCQPPNGSASGFWNVSPDTEALLDQLLVWRELGFNFCQREPNYDRFESLPAWAQQTLLEHAADPRQPCYQLSDFEHARTHDPLWNAAQRQLLREGRIHNYLRMLWGKKILHWSASPTDALEILIELNNKYALDGRNPNSYSGIFWTLGRYDRAWGPERPIFGKVRYMTSDSTQRKFKVSRYLQRYGASS